MQNKQQHLPFAAGEDRAAGIIHHLFQLTVKAGAGRIQFLAACQLQMFRYQCVNDWRHTAQFLHLPGCELFSFAAGKGELDVVV